MDVFESPEVAAADRSSRPCFGAVGPSPRLSVIGDLEITESGMRLLGLIRGVRGIWPDWRRSPLKPTAPRAGRRA